jgi:hypothetical protein
MQVVQTQEESPEFGAIECQHSLVWQRLSICNDDNFESLLCKTNSSMKTDDVCITAELWL